VISFSKDKGEPNAEQVKQEALRRENEKTLLELSSSKLNVVVAALITSLEKLDQVRCDRTLGKERLLIALTRISMRVRKAKLPMRTRGFTS
jgi:DeoR/GlpR family transcriptional regulator of sugar metabolism